MRRNRSNETISTIASSVRPAASVLSSSVNVTFAWLIACAGVTAFGYHLAVVNGVLDQIIFEMGVGGKWKVVAIVQGLIVGLHLAGIALGSLSGDALSDRIGLRAALLLAAQPLILAPLVSMQAPMFEHWDGMTHQFDGRPLRSITMLASRFILGCASGVVATVVPTYLQQVAPAAARGGPLAGLSQVFTCVGIVTALVSNAVLPASLWRASLFVGEVPAITLAIVIDDINHPRQVTAVVFGFEQLMDPQARGLDVKDRLDGMLLCPESPGWLQKKGKQAEADAAAQWLWGANALSEMNTPPVSGPPSSHSSPSQPVLRDAAFAFTLSWPKLGELDALLRKAAGVAALLVPYQPLCGLHPLLFFSTMFFRQVGVVHSRRMSVLVGLANLLGTLLAAFASKSSNQRAVVNCWLGQALAMFAIALASRSSGVLVVAASLFCALSFGFGAGPVSSLTKPDLNSASTKGPAVTLGVLSHWLYHVALGTVFPLLLELLHLPVMWSLLGLVALLEAVYCWSQGLAVRSKDVGKL